MVKSIGPHIQGFPSKVHLKNQPQVMYSLFCLFIVNLSSVSWRYFRLRIDVNNVIFFSTPYAENFLFWKCFEKTGKEKNSQIINDDNCILLFLFCILSTAFNVAITQLSSGIKNNCVSAINSVACPRLKQSFSVPVDLYNNLQKVFLTKIPSLLLICLSEKNKATRALNLPEILAY